MKRPKDNLGVHNANCFWQMDITKITCDNFVGMMWKNVKDCDQWKNKWKVG